MRIVLAILVVLGAIVAALFALGILPPASGPENGGGAVSDGPGTPVETDGPNGSGLTGGGPEVPDTMPPLESLPIREGINVLLLAGYAERIPATLTQHWGGHPDIRVHAWVEHAGVEGAGSGTPEGGVLPKADTLDREPVPLDLQDLDIDVIVLHGLSPEALDDAFWQAVAERVMDGRAGLIAMPGRPEGTLLFENAALRDLLPLRETGSMEGSPLPGDLGRRAPYEVTSQGRAHPASRMIAWPEWSATWWQAKAGAEYPWGTALTWPVGAVTADGVTLLQVTPARGDPIPAFVAGLAGDGRVLFFGPFEFMERKGYGQPQTMQELQTWIRNWLVWATAQDRS